MRSYFSPGKIMLCGEYAVTIGVEALAVPSVLGQWMYVWEFDSPAGGDRLIWESRVLVSNQCHQRSTGS